MTRSNTRRFDPSARDSESLNRAQQQSMLENMPEVLALIGADGLIKYVNPYTEKVLSYRAAELVGRNIFDFVHPDDVPRASQEYADTVQHQGERPPSVLRLRNAAGAWVPFEIVANNRLDSDIQAVIFAARDLRFREEIETAIHGANADTAKQVVERTTELAKINAELRIENNARCQAENQLQHTVSLLNATLNSTADGILVVSTEGKVTSCNQKFLEMWHLSCESSVGKEDSSLLASAVGQLQNPSDFLDKVRSLYANPSATSFDVLHFKDGRIFERYSQPQRISDKIVGRVWSFRDVTRARNLETELRQSQKMEALGRLAGGIAHDFNNLLMLISGYVTQLVENPSLAEAHGTCEQILATTNRAASVTRQLLAFSRKHPDAPAVVDLNVVVSDMERMLRRLLSDQIKLQITVTPDPQPVYVDVSQIEMMIINLAINAQDAMSEGGLLSIATSHAVLPPAVDSAESSNDYAVLSVSDTGHGMTPEVQAHIFEPFFTTKQMGKGTGLGLSTAFGIAERAGGRIEVQSEVNHGATFRVYFPQVAGTPVAITHASRLPLPRGGDETVLLAEDEAGIRTMTRAYLEGLGYRVLEASDGAEAIRLSLEYEAEIHLVLTDVLMPGMRGDAAVEMIRSRRPGIKALFMSGYADQDMDENSDNMLHKPFEFPELGRRIRSVLDAPAPNPDLPAAG